MKQVLAGFLLGGDGIDSLKIVERGCLYESIDSMLVMIMVRVIDLQNIQLEISDKKGN